EFSRKRKKSLFALPNSIRKRLRERRKKKQKSTKPKKGLSGSAKKAILKAVFLGKQAVYKLKLGRSNIDFELIAGLFLIMQCPDVEKHDKVRYAVWLSTIYYFLKSSENLFVFLFFQKKVEWYIDGVKFDRNSLFTWRIRINPQKQLEIWPLLVEEDDGRYECYVNGEPKGAVSLHVITVTVRYHIDFFLSTVYDEGVLKGIYNYLVASLFSAPIVLFAIIFRLTHPQREAIIPDDPVVEFYERILELKAKEMKGHLAKSVYKDKLEEKRAAITTMMTYASKYNVGPDGERLRCISLKAFWNMKANKE
ncbi:unnamed protein product, partial [Toxocara canis]|uniref:Ig-like domain-containing protein n=1 Tax=Toxocara canis TaxID=6265 RepID=A0A183V2U6_TOXCA